jgi:hypothetical protein
MSPIAKHGDAITKSEYLLHSMRDIDHCDLPFLQLCQQFRRVIRSVNVTTLDPAWPDEGALDAATLGLGSATPLANLDGPFSSAPRTAAFRAPARPRAHLGGCTPESYNLTSLGVFLWRLPASPIDGAEPGHGPGRRYLTFHPLGIDTPLLRPPLDRSSPWDAPGAENVPLAISRLLLAAWTDTWREWVAQRPRGSTQGLPSLGFTIRVDGVAIPPNAIYVPGRDAGDECDLLGRVAPPPDETYAVVDPERGRFAVGGSDGAITLDWAWGQAGPIGGGPYDRDSTMVSVGADTLVLLVARHVVPPPGVEVFRDISAAFHAARRAISKRAAASPEPDCGASVLIRILDSATYDAAQLQLSNRERFTLQAVDGARPVVRAGHEGVALQLHAKGPACVVLSGLLLGGSLDVRGELDLTLLDSSLHPSEPTHPALRWSAPPGAGEPRLGLTRCIVGPLRLPTHVATRIEESIVDGRGGVAIGDPELRLGPPLELTAVSVLGNIFTAHLERATDVLIAGVVRARAASLETLKNARFELELEIPSEAGAADRASPTRAPRFEPAGSPFTSTRYGDPGYCQLRLDAGEELLRGGSGGAELGAFRALASGQRLANLQPVLDDYLPFGLDADVLVMDRLATPLAPAASKRRRGEGRS